MYISDRNDTTILCSNPHLIKAAMGTKSFISNKAIVNIEIVKTLDCFLFEELIENKLKKLEL